MLNSLYDQTHRRFGWLVLAFSAFAFEAAALYFQYGMKLEPCIMCIYQRMAVAGIGFSALIGAIAPSFFITRITAIIGWTVSAAWGAEIAYEHVKIQTNTDPFSFFTCDSQLNLPEWFPLNEWLPGVFEATGDCNTIDWQFLGYSMPQWMIVIFASYTIVALLAVLSQFRHRPLGS